MLANIDKAAAVGYLIPAMDKWVSASQRCKASPAHSLGSQK